MIDESAGYYSAPVTLHEVDQRIELARRSRNLYAKESRPAPAWVTSAVGSVIVAAMILAVLALCAAVVVVCWRVIW